MAPESPMKDHPLGLAARYNDADAEEHGLIGAVERQGLDLDAVIYLSKQRALRVIAIGNPKLEHLLGNHSDFIEVPPLTADEQMRLVIFQSAILDGILIGWRGRQLSEKGETDG